MVQYKFSRVVFSGEKAGSPVPWRGCRNLRMFEGPRKHSSTSNVSNEMENISAFDVFPCQIVPFESSFRHLSKKEESSFQKNRKAHILWSRHQLQNSLMCVSRALWPGFHQFCKGPTLYQLPLSADIPLLYQARCGMRRTLGTHLIIRGRAVDGDLIWRTRWPENRRPGLHSWLTLQRVPSFECMRSPFQTLLKWFVLCPDFLPRFMAALLCHRMPYSWWEIKQSEGILKSR